MKKDKKQEFILRITGANKTQLVVILYEMVLEYLQDSLEAFECKDFSEYKWNIERAKDCIDELLNSLHPEYEIAGVLKSLYYFYKRELTTAAVQRKAELIMPVIQMIKELKESYGQVSAQDTSAPIMQNTQTVYAGLTYGKGSLNVNLSDQGSSRGFRV